MSVDMYEQNFRKKLSSIKHSFTPNDNRDKRVWSVNFPSWRALFSSVCFYCHSTGYRVPSFDQFYKICESAYRHEKHRGKFDIYFEEKLLAPMRQRIGAWYESGMAETYLYSCLVEALEDKTRSGVVLYDARADWKLKADLITIVNEKPILVSAFTGKLEERSAIEKNRDEIERETKKNTMESSHWRNSEIERMEKLEIALDTNSAQVINGVRLFNRKQIDSLLEEIYKIGEISPQNRFYFTNQGN